MSDLDFSPAVDGTLPISGIRSFVTTSANNSILQQDIVSLRNAQTSIGTIIVGTFEADQFVVETNQTIFGGNGNDLIDATNGGGGNRLYGGEGDDELLARSDDRLFGEVGNDLLDASTGSGGNRLYGGEGRDILLAGGNDDNLIGGIDNDLLFAGLGGTTLTGQEGIDQFIVTQAAFPEQRHIITDFQVSIDKIAILGLPNIDDFSDITLVQTGQDTLIQATGNDLVLLSNITSTDLTETDILFTAPELIGPTIAVALIDDTGLSSTDNLTNQPAITGSVIDASSIVSFRAGFNDRAITDFVDVLTDLQSDSGFTLTTSRLAEIFGNATNILGSGDYTLHLIAEDALGNISTFDFM